MSWSTTVICRFCRLPAAQWALDGQGSVLKVEFVRMAVGFAMLNDEVSAGVALPLVRVRA